MFPLNSSAAPRAGHHRDAMVLAKAPCSKSQPHHRPIRRSCDSSWQVASLLESVLFPPGIDRAREHLPQRIHRRHDHAEIRRKFDEIVAFAGVEKFSTPPSSVTAAACSAAGICRRAHMEPNFSSWTRSRRRRRRVPEKMHEQCRMWRAARADCAVREPQHVAIQSLCEQAVLLERAVKDADPQRRDCKLSVPEHGVESDGHWDDPRARRATASCGSGASPHGRP